MADWWLLLAEPMNYEFMQRAMVVSVVAGIVCGVLSCWLILIGWSLMGDAIAHSVLPGVILAYVLGAPFALGALVFGLAAVALIGGLQDRTKIRGDAAIGVVFTTLFAFGIVMISVTPSQIDLTHILFGNVLGISDSDLVQVLVLGSAVLLVVAFKWRDFTLFAFDRMHAQVLGLRPRLLSALLLLLLAVTVVVALKAVGVVLVVALLITPGAAAFMITDRFARMIVIAPAISVVAAIVGIIVSYHLDAAPGGMVVLALGVIFAGAFLFGGHQGVLRRNSRIRGGRRDRDAQAGGSPAANPPEVPSRS